MGCEFCQNGSRENIEFKLAAHPRRSIDLKTKFDEYVLKKTEKILIKNDVIYRWAILSHK